MVTNVWYQNPHQFILPKNITPGRRIAFHVNKWHGMHKMQVARVEHLDNGTVRIKAGLCGYTFWYCYWHLLAQDEVVWLLGDQDGNSSQEES